MKRRIGVIVSLMMIIGIMPSFASDATIKNLDFVDYAIIEEGCLECDNSVEIVPLGDMYIERLDGGKTFSCDRLANHESESDDNKECDFSCKATYDSSKGLKYVYSTNPENEIRKSIKVSNSDREHSSLVSKAENQYVKQILDEVYEEVTVYGSRYYIYKDLLEGNRYNRNLYTRKDGELCLVSFNKEEIDIYHNKREETRVVERNLVSNKYEIMSFYNDGIGSVKGKKTPNNNETILNQTTAHFLVCETHRKCLACDRNVAGNGGEFVSVRGKSEISSYCAEHACAFIWDTVVAENAGLNIEGLTCKAPKYTSDYCNSHTCNSDCSNPVVGVSIKNMLSNKDKILNYYGSNEYSYSNYCIDHYCQYSGCRNPRQATTATYEYCTRHLTKCAITGCTNTQLEDYDGIFICANHRKDLKTCSFCGNPYIEAVGCITCKILNTVDGDVITNTIGTGERELTPDMLSWNDYDESVTMGDGLVRACLNCGKVCKLKTDRFCEDCASLGLEDAKLGICDHCKEIRVLVNNKYCKPCSELGLGVQGKCHNCGVLAEVLYLNDNGLLVCELCLRGANTKIPDTVAITIKPVMYYNTCNHNHAVLGNIRINKKSSQLHTQEWECAGCGKTLTKDFAHTYFSNGKCICEMI